MTTAQELPPAKRNIPAITLSVLLALVFVSAGLGKVMDTPPSPENFTRWQLSMGFMHAIGALEVAGGVALLIPAVSALSAVGLFAIMGGALRTGLAFREPLHIWLPLTLMVMLAALVWARPGVFTKFLRRG
ncbi:MAG: DoxX family protein [Deltaproteobacteria bacterium]|nr:DoxX family protein [Deltaproteobacteria bacterium]